ncbi:MAG: Smr/MutS family protein, partial [bacterium]
DEARNFFDRERALPTFQGIMDMREHVGRAGKGSVLDPVSLYKINATLKSIRTIRQTIRDCQFEYPRLTSEAQTLGVFPEIEDALDHAIHPDGEVLDRASSALHRIRRELMTERERAERSLASMINDYSRLGYLREANFTMKNGRYVLPFREDCRKNVKSVVQARSPSGATVFVEPYELVDRNNRLSELKGDEETEIGRILAEISQLVGSRSDEILNTIQTSVFLDFIFACGRLSRDWKGVRSMESSSIDIKAARHPLIPPTEVVPVDIVFPGDVRGLIISGPNAGGKTVALKTLGLFAAINQAGLHIPAGDSSELPIFGSVHAEIGDRQSIEWNLSSFSAHIVFLKRMMASLAEPDHLPAIKNLVLKGDPRVAGASVEFDIEKTEPLYKIRTGTLGASYALAIAKRLGLDPEIIKNAENHLTEKGDLLQLDIPGLENLLESLKEKVRKAEIDSRKANRSILGLSVLHRLIMLSAIQDAEAVGRKAYKILHDARKISDRLPHKLEPEEISEEIDLIGKYLDKLRTAANALASPVGFTPPLGDEAEIGVSAPLEVGKPVWVLSLRREAELVELDSKNATVIVAGKKLKISPDQIRPLEGDETTVKKIPKPKTPGHKSLPLFMDLHGLTVEEALLRIDPYLDEAYYQGRERAHIIHGFGTGKLRKGIHEYLKKHPLVDSFELADLQQGGGGVTVVTLKRGKPGR